MDAPPLFKIENKDVIYNGGHALQQICLEVFPEEIIALVGPSGAGKTSLLNELYKLRPQDCTFIRQCEDITLHRSVFQNILMADTSGHTFFGTLLNRIKPQKKTVTKILPIAQRLDLTEKMFVKTKYLSNEQKHRVAVGRAIYQHRPILLADEPISPLPAHLRESVLMSIIESAKTAVISLHSIELSLKYAKRIVGMRRGRIRFDLPALQVTSDHIGDLYISV